MADYKSSKEAFVSGMTGSTVTHINLISLSALSSIALHSALTSRSKSSSSPFLTDFLILILPLLLSITHFGNTPTLLLLLLLFPTVLILLFKPDRAETKTADFHLSLPPPSPSISRSKHRENASTPNSPTTEVKKATPPLPALTTYRAHMLLMTILSILSVDFPIFPRSLVKCETYGVSLMDLGVGSFVFSQGLVSAIPIVRDPTYLLAPLRPKIYTAIRKVWPILGLGLIRVLLVKGTEYPEHTSEYGVHWNFFITLALLPIFQICLHPFIKQIPIAAVGSVVAILHQVALSAGLEKWGLEAPRVGLISQNKEGIVSLIGYLAIHLLGLATGTLLLPPTPSHFRRAQRALAHQPTKKGADTDTDHDSDSDTDKRFPKRAVGAGRAKRGKGGGIEARQNDKTVIEVFSYAVVWWVLMWLSRVVGGGVGGGVSRRFTNLSYILWVSAFNTSFICGYLLLDLYFFPSPLSTSVYSKTSGLKMPPPLMGDGDVFRKDGNADGDGSRNRNGNSPVLLEAVNKNGLVLFLIANLATGVINLTLPTMYMSDILAMLVLNGYAMGICGIAWVWRDRRIWKL